VILRIFDSSIGGNLLGSCAANVPVKKIQYSVKAIVLPLLRVDMQFIEPWVAIAGRRNLANWLDALAMLYALIVLAIPVDVGLVVFGCGVVYCDIL
jgi:hypothetical protein